MQKTIRCELKEDEYGLRPYVNITLRSRPMGNLDALIDTGASVSIFPESFARRSRQFNFLSPNKTIDVGGWRLTCELVQLLITVYDKDDNLDLWIKTLIINEKTPLGENIAELPLILGCESIMPDPNDLDTRNALHFITVNSDTEAILNFHQVVR